MGNIKEIDEALDEHTMEEHVLNTIAKQHHHRDGTPVELHIVEEGGIEKDLQSEMARFNQAQEQRGQQEVAAAASKGEITKGQIHEQPSLDLHHDKGHSVMAGCSCGDSFKAVFGGKGGLQLATYELSGRDAGDAGYNMSGAPTGDGGYTSGSPQGDLGYRSDSHDGDPGYQLHGNNPKKDYV